MHHYKQTVYLDWELAIEPTAAERQNGHSE